jgi:hypothetical protein
MDTKETVSKKEYDDLVEAYKECQVKYQREVGSIRRSVLQAYECIKDDEWMAEDLSQGAIDSEVDYAEQSRLLLLPRENQRQAPPSYPAPA